jgi:hypothetical protein
MPHFLSRLLLVTLPLAALLVVEALLPIDAFTFRAWEALEIRSRLVDTRAVRLFPWTTLPGPFLPDARLELVEEGDLGHHTPLARRRLASWVTDAWGYRVSPGGADPELVLVGDSEVVGTGLDQRETIAEVLRTGHGLGAYPYAPSNLAAFFADRRFSERPPRWLVVECVERQVLEDFRVMPTVRPKPRPVQLVHSAPLRAFETAWNRLTRMAALGYLRARINGRPPPLARGDLLFLRGLDGTAAPDPARVGAAADTLALLAARARDRGMRFAVLVVPDKETIYADLFDGAVRPPLLAALRRELEARGVEAIDLEGPFLAARARGEQPYLSDDTHWSAAGVSLAGALVAGWARAPAQRVLTK